MEFNINDIFRNSFGYEAPEKFVIKNAPASGYEAPNKFVINNAPARLKYSSLGQPYYGKDILGRQFFLPVNLQGVFRTSIGYVPFNYLIPFAVMSVSCRKTIVSDLMPEKGRVTETISLDDYVINIKGLAINDSNEFPEQQIINIHNIFKVGGNVILRSALSDIFLNGVNDHKVIIRSLNFPANPGIQNAKPFEIDCISDMIDTLEV